MIVPSVWPEVLDVFGTALVIEPTPAQSSRDAGLLLLRQFDRRIELARAFTRALDDPRDGDLTRMPLSNATFMADVPDSKSGPRKRVWVQVPPSVLLVNSPPAPFPPGGVRRAPAVGPGKKIRAYGPDIRRIEHVAPVGFPRGEYSVSVHHFVISVGSSFRAERK